MIRLTICLLLYKAAFAQYAVPGAPSPVPMDFNDDIYNRDMRIPPSSNFIYNFEHARRDQPPHVEMREENLGKYMGRPRTTTQVPFVPKLSEQSVPEIETVHLHHLSDVKSVSMKPYVPQQWDPISSHLPATIPPAPTTPKWMDLSDETFRHHAHHKPSRPTLNGYQHASTQPPVPEWNKPATFYMNDMVQQPEMSYSSHPMPQYIPPSTEHAVPAGRFAQSAPSQQRPSSRGNHKFSWSDVKMPEQPAAVPTTSTPSAVAPQNRGPPPSIPTLSPWYDGFGK